MIRRTTLTTVYKRLSTMASTSPPPQPLRPVVAVIGTTGVGKSDLAVSLAQALKTPSSAAGLPTNGIVLSADSMQLYKGLDVITNKVTEEEKGGIEHWGLDMVTPGEGGSWELGKWCNEVDKVVAQTPPSTLPIICGGTHYFIQHFLFPPPELSTDRSAERDSAKATDLRWTPPGPLPPVPEDMDLGLRRLLETFWTPDAVFPGVSGGNGTSTSASSSRPTVTDEQQLLAIWRVLEAVDPQEAGRWHWRDGRKVRRALERWWERGGGEVQPAVEESGADARRRAKFRTLIFWVYEPLDSLRPRLDSRVDKMVQRGLLGEIEELRGVATRLYGSADPSDHDHAEGIFQSIGYKEFTDLPLPMENPESDPNFGAMLTRMKLSTHQYAKSQIKWIKKQLLPAVREARSLGGDVEVYVVPGGVAGQPIAHEVLEAFLAGRELPNASAVGHKDAAELLRILAAEETKVPDTADRQLLNARKVCDTCSAPDRPFSIRAQDWDIHLTSKVHKRNAKLAGFASREAYIAAQKAKGLARQAEKAAQPQQEQEKVQPEE